MESVEVKKRYGSCSVVKIAQNGPIQQWIFLLVGCNFQTIFSSLTQSIWDIYISKYTIDTYVPIFIILHRYLNWKFLDFHSFNENIWNISLSLISQYLGKSSISFSSDFLIKI